MTQAELAALSNELTRLARYNQLELYHAYPKLREFHAAGRDNPERLLMAANRVGKCVTASTRIEHPDGTWSTAGDLFDRFRPFSVLGWDGEKVVEAQAIDPICKPPEECYRVWLSSGLWFECADYHRVLTPSGYAFVDEASTCVPSLPPSTSGRGLLVRASNALRWLQRAQDSLAGCLLRCRSHDGQPHVEAGTGAASTPSQGGARPPGVASCRTDGRGSSDTSSGRPLRGHPSNQGVVRRLAGRCAAWSVRASCTIARRLIGGCQAALRLAIVEAVRFRSTGGTPLGREQGAALLSPFNADNRIIAYQSVGFHEVYDFTVPETSNYIAAGVVHHNTFGGSREVAYHLTGRYPRWWEGRTWSRGTRWWVASETTEMTVAGVQGNLLGRVEDGLGTGAVPKDAIVEYKRSAHGFPGSIQFAIIRHGGGGDVQAQQSYVGFKSYDQGREKFQADTLDGVWLDEEPDSALYFEALTRISTTKGMVFMTFTPLKGPTAVVTRFLLEKPAGTIVVNMTIDDAEHIPPEERDKIIARYPAHEREARTKGVPAMGSGRIFPVTEATITVQRFKVPDHWHRIGGLDFGWDHPTAAVELCIDRDHDRYFVTRAFRQREATPITFAAALRAWGMPWLPWAWPHDGLQHDKGSGIQLAEAYRAQSLNLTAEKATFVDGSNGVEAGVQQMLDLMLSGRFFVCEDLTEWFEEFRFYHRQDGKIVKMNDDLMSATRYAFMMQRFAEPSPREIRKSERAGRGSDNWRTL